MDTDAGASTYRALERGGEAAGGLLWAPGAHGGPAKACESGQRREWKEQGPCGQSWVGREWKEQGPCGQSWVGPSRVSQGQLPTCCRTRAALVLSPGLEQVKGGAVCAASFGPSSPSVKVLFLHHLLIVGAQALAKPQS